ncbi:hypothetical protein EYR36_011948 [Pleurotus pulmonarius]|nr:hypothetical protein EYR36_011948 [Pleurotus pulmonarius]
MTELSTTRWSVTAHDMPPEVLCHIFVTLAAMCFDEDLGTYSLDWIAVTHVCKLWNEVAHDNATLWSHIDFSHPRWAQEMLGRAKCAPLDIHYRHHERSRDGVTGEEVMAQALKRLPLIRRMGVDAPVDVLKRFVIEMEGFPAPELERLHMRGTRDELVEIQANFLDEFAPRLRDVALLGCSIDLSTRLFRNVESLVLGPINSPIHIADMLTFLSNLPKIQSLVTGFSFHLPQGPEVVRLLSREPVLMPNLTRMQLTTRWSDPSQDLASPTMFLRWLKFMQPLDIEVYLGCEQDEDTILPQCESLFDPVLQHAATKAMEFSDFDMTYSSDSQKHGAEVHELRLSACSDSALVSFTFWFVQQLLPETCQSLAARFATGISRKGLRTINMDGITLDAQFMGQKFGNLEYLGKIYSSLNDELYTALQDVDVQGRCLFPTLSTLTLYYDEDDEDVDAWFALPGLLEIRARMGFPTRDITILSKTGSTVPQLYVDRLEDIVSIRLGSEVSSCVYRLG